MFEHIALITGNDTTALANPIRGISFGTAGTLKVLTAGGETVTIPDGPLAVGVIHKIAVVQVFLTGTTVTEIVGYW